MSLNQRIIISAGVVLFFFITITAAALNSAFVESSENALRNQLTSQLYALMAAAEVDSDGVVLPTDELDSLLGLPSSGLYAFVTDDKGNVLWQSSSLLDADPPNPMVLAAGDKHFFTFSKADKNYWIHAYGVNWVYEDELDDTKTTTIALTFNIITDLAGYQANIDEYRGTLWRWLLGMAAFLIITQAIILRWGLSPLRKVSAELNEIESGSQDQIEDDYPKEIKRLTDNINTLLLQERNQKTRYRNALGDLAHSLKTPLAVLQSSIDKQAVGNPEGDVSKINITQDNDTQANVRQQLERMNSIVEYQLQRAATAGAGGTGQALPIRALFERIIDSLQKVYRDKHLDIDIDIDAQLTMTADEGDMMELFGNLLDNACKWAESRVEIRYVEHNQRHQLTISDDGPGIKPELAEELLKRGVRADEAIAGHGIGLSIVRDIVDAYHGEMHIGSSASGGAEITITL